MSYMDNIVVGDYKNGNLYAFDLDVYSDNGETQRWLRSWRALPTSQNNLTRTAQHSLQLDCQTGVGLRGAGLNDELTGLLATQNDALIVTDLGFFISVSSDVVYAADPRVMLRWSDDGGHTWSNEHWKSIGRIGQYGYRTFWRRLGMTQKIRDRVYELSMTDPVKVAIMGAELHLSGTNA
jgi:hypothetical protein